MTMESESPANDPDIKTLQSKLGEEKFKQLTEQTSFIISQFKNRRKKVKEKLLQPPTPTKPLKIIRQAKPVVLLR